MSRRTGACGRRGDPFCARGFTLLEVLVALVVIAVGMLGIAVMYVEGMKAERTSVYRTTAVTLVADLADRIRANATATAAYAGVGASHGCTHGVDDCSPQELAQEDLWWWQRDIAQRLFISQHGKALTRHGIYRLCRKYLRMALPEKRLEVPLCGLNSRLASGR